MEKLKKVLLRFFVFIGITVFILVAGIYSIMWIVVNGPSPMAKDLFVLSVRESSAGGFLADIYCSDEEIADIEKRNKVETTDEITDTSFIKIEVNNKEENDDDTSDSQGEGSKKNQLSPGIYVEDVSGTTFKGKIMIIEDPSRVFVGSLDKYGEDVRGQNIFYFLDKYDAIAGSNAGGFYDKDGHGTGGIPDGIVISQGKLKYGELDKNYEVIGINNDNILVVGYMTGQQALNMGIRDAVSFGPILIVNGVPNNCSGIGGGLNPRTAIGQRSDGAILLLVVDGRQASSLGASMNDLMNIMLEYGAVNAANLDGGSSTALYHNGKPLNQNSSIVGMRDMPTTIMIR